MKKGYDKTKVKTNRLGETRVMNNGLTGTIIRYGCALDIDVALDDGHIERNRDYYDFRRGLVTGRKSRRQAYDFGPNLAKQNIRVGETRKMKNGLKAAIIDYENCKCMTIRFENGVTRRNVEYSNFKKGTVSTNPKYCDAP